MPQVSCSGSPIPVSVNPVLVKAATPASDRLWSRIHS